MSVRAFFQVAKVENAAFPYDTIHLKVFYPAQRSASPQEQDMGIVPADEGRSPFKVVIFLMVSTAVQKFINGLRLN
jgi:hypothetical protein